jgi:nitrile hydratase subunit beta
MDGVHDLGGRAGFGPVVVEPDEPVFHEPWERRVFGMTANVLVGPVPTGSFRHSIERMDPLHYLGSSYFEHWLTGLATLLVDRGLVSIDELEPEGLEFPLGRPVTSSPILGPDRASGEPRLAVGDRVRVRNVQSAGHTRCPGYVRGHEGVVVAHDGLEAIPERSAHTDEDVPEHAYRVRFEAAELWGEVAEAGTAVHVDLMEHYLERT